MNLLVALFLSFLPSKDIAVVVNAFHNLKSEEEEMRFIKTYKDSNAPTVLGYVYATEMKQASYTVNPYKKLKIFKDTKIKLHTLIEQNPGNLHLRYIRLLLQERTPKVLGYRDYIEEDKQMLRFYESSNTHLNYLYHYIHNNTSL